MPKMSMFTLAISCLTTSNLPWFMDLTTFQVPMQYFYVQHRTLLPSPVLATTGCCFRFGSAFIPSGAISPLSSSSMLGTYWPGKFIFQCHTFLPLHTVHGVSMEEYWSGLPFRYDVNQIPYTVEVTNRFKGLDLIECLKYYEQSFVTLYKRQWSIPSPIKRNAKGENGCLRRPYK